MYLYLFTLLLLFIPTDPCYFPQAGSAKKKALVTGYILYSGEVRKQVTTGNPEKTFGEVSRIVGNEVCFKVSIFYYFLLP